MLYPFCSFPHLYQCKSGPSIRQHQIPQQRHVARIGTQGLEHRVGLFVEQYNHERPHPALNMKYPAKCYRSSPRPYTGLPELEYPFHDRTVTVTQCGRLCFGTRSDRNTPGIRGSGGEPFPFPAASIDVCVKRRTGT